MLRDKKEQARAVEKYLKAVDLAGEAGDKGLQGRIYANLGFLYYRQKLYIEADSLYQLSETIGWELTGYAFSCGYVVHAWQNLFY